MTQTIIFDLDGTLVDSLPDLAAALNRLLAARALAPIEPQIVATMVGDGAGALVKRGFAHYQREPDEAALSEFLTDYTANATNGSRPYPGVPDTLAALRHEGFRLGVCTNKPQEATTSMLLALGLASAFDAVCGGDTNAFRKPDPRHLLATIDAVGGTALRSVMVGDHTNDIDAATGAGAASIFAAWGYGQPARPADATAARMAEVPSLAHALLARRETA